VLGDEAEHFHKLPVAVICCGQSRRPQCRRQTTTLISQGHDHERAGPRASADTGCEHGPTVRHNSGKQRLSTVAARRANPVQLDLDAPDDETARSPGVDGAGNDA
jgi:hypothetical protein